MNTQNLGLGIGYTADILIFISNLAQLYAIYKDKSAQGLSYIFLTLSLIVCIMYTVSGIINNIAYIYSINII
jgi:uncharacterized protein with PQ loop repeat